MTKDLTNRPNGAVTSDRRTVIKGIGAAATAGAAASVIGAPAVHAQKKQLRFLNAEPSAASVEALRVAAAEWEAKTGVEVVIDSVPAGDAFNKLQASIRAGRPYDVGTLIFLAHVLLLADEGQLVPVTNLINKHEWGKRILFPINGEHYWYMYDYNLCFLNYRTDIYNKLGLPAPTTQDQLLDNIKAITASDDGTRFGIAHPIGSNGATNYMSFGYMWANGVSMFDDNWNFTFGNAENLNRTAAFVDYFAELYNYIPSGMTQASFGEMISLYVGEQIAHVPYPGRLIDSLEVNNPELANNISILPYPSADGDIGAVNHGYDGWVVVDTPMAEESMKFLEWLSEEHYINFLHTSPIHYQPPRMDVYEDPRWLAHPSIKKHAGVIETMRGFLERDDIIIRSIDTEGPEPDLRAGKVFETYALAEMLQNKLIRGAPTDQVVAEAAAKMRAVLPA
ncbi:MAG: extracellular solute-binding protein [Pseudomonadota bacterium]